MLDGVWPAIMWLEFVVALELFGIVVLMMLLVVLGLVGDLRGDENIGKRVRVGVQFEAVNHQTVRFGGCVDGEIEFEVAAVRLMVLGLAIVLLKDWRAAWAVQAYALGLCDSDALDRNRLDDFDFVGAQLGWEKKCVGSSRQASCGKERSK